MGSLNREAYDHCDWTDQLQMVRLFLDRTDSISFERRQLISDLVTILEPFEVVTSMIEDPHSQTASLVIPSTHQLTDTISAMTAHSNTGAQLIIDLRKAVIEYLNSVLSCEEYSIATLLDPRFKSTYAQPDLSEKVIRMAQPKEEDTRHDCDSVSVIQKASLCSWKPRYIA